MALPDFASVAPLILHVAGAGTSWTTIVVAALGIGGTLGGAISGARLTQSGEDRRWNATQIALHNAARAERLRPIYARVVLAATMLQGVVVQRNVLMGGETVEQRDERHNAQVKEAMAAVREVAGELIIEDSAVEVTQAYSSLVMAMDRHMASEKMPAGTARAEALNQASEEILSLSNEIEELARQHLSRLDQPPQVGIARTSEAQPEIEEAGDGERTGA